MPFTPDATHPIAFFCAEFGVDSALPIYAGGLGVLAGDILKEAADQNLPYVGVGLLYRGEGAVQEISSEGEQIEKNYSFDPLSLGLEHVYLDEMPLFIKVHLTQLDIWVRCWKKKIGETVTLYLLDTDTEQNHASDRRIAHALYAGSEEEVIKQQLILGIGGVKLLHALGIHPSLYHVNEGRPAFLHWQLIRSHMDENGMSFKDANELARQKTVYTNHTLVEAGNQQFTAHFLRAYGTYYAKRMGVEIDDLLKPGLDQSGEHFSITEYALNTSRKASAVSQLHYQFCQQQWPTAHWVGITNGIHLPTWQNSEVATHLHDPNQLWFAHLGLKRRTMEYIQKRTGFGYDPNRLVLTWSRRIAGYKQIDGLFADLQRLKSILSVSNKPVQLLIAGKAHIYDTAAKKTLQKIIHYLQTDLSGYALFIPNLDIELDQMLVSGSDVWLNTPEYGKEASGTSGMKALSNGVLQCTVADGWANEVEWNGIGWKLDPHHLSESFYHFMERDIQPLFYARSSERVPLEWVRRMQESIQLSSKFSATRMIKQYCDELYS